MARFLTRLACFLTLQLPILAAVVIFGAPSSGDHYLSAIADKRAMLADASRPRLIFVGGSNVAFGIHSHTFAESLDLRPVNFGLHAGLGLELPLQLVEQSVREGDYVVVTPEYSLLATQAYQGDPETIARLMEQWPEARRLYDHKYQPGLKSMLDRDGVWMAHVWVQRARHRLKHGSVADDIYTRSNFNQYGDMIGHHGRPPQHVGKHSLLPAIADACVQRSVQRLNAFQQACAAKGATVLFSYPAVPRDLYDQSRPLIEQLHAALEESLEIPIAHRPADAAYPRELFFDTAYHLTEEGAQRRSKSLLGYIEAEIKVARQAGVAARPGRSR